MTKEHLAALLDGRQYGEEITKAEETAAKMYGLVVVFGGSDDLMEFRGTIYDEVGCYNGGTALIHKNTVTDKDGHDCDCGFCGYKEFEKKAKAIEAVWSKDGYSWTYKTDIPHATFDIMEDGEKFCRGIVFEIASCQ